MKTIPDTQEFPAQCVKSLLPSGRVVITRKQKFGEVKSVRAAGRNGGTILT